MFQTPWIKMDALESPRDAQLEGHRALVREYHLKAQRVYGFPGLVALLLALVPLVVAWMQGALWSALPWVLCVTTFLVAMLGVRFYVKRHIKVLQAQLTDYCAANQIDLGALCLYYTKAHADYPFFDVFTPKASESMDVLEDASTD